MNIQFRQYCASDHDEVFELHNVALNAVGAHNGNGPWDNDLHHIEEIYLRNGGEFLVGVVSGRIVAMGALKKIDNACALVRRMRVHPDLQRQGIGQTILDKLELQARLRGFTTLRLDTTVQQVPAQRLYQRNGFFETSRKRQGQFEVIYFEKRLPPLPGPKCKTFEEVSQYEYLAQEFDIEKSQ